MSDPRVIVALETSFREASVALSTPDGVHVARLEAERAHASDLLPEVARLVADAGLTPAELEAVFVGLGPGSYTGLRVGIATALGLARGTGALLQGAPSVEALAFGHLHEDGLVTVLLDARGGAAYHARYARRGPAWEVEVAPEAIAVGRAPQVLASSGAILGDATVADRAGLSDAQRARLTSDARPDATAVLELARTRLERDGPLAPEDLAPLYLRAFGETPA